MDLDVYEDLATKALAGSLTNEERSRLERLVGSDPELKRRFQEITGFDKLLRDLAPYMREARLPDRPVPERYLVRFREAVKQHSPILQYTQAWVQDQLKQCSLAFKSQGGSGILASNLRKLEEILGSALGSFLSGDLVPVAAFRRAGSQAIYSPLNNTIHTTPTILWRCAAGKRYDVFLQDEAGQGQILKALGVVSPLPFSAFGPGPVVPLPRRAYFKLTIREAGHEEALAEEVFFTAAPSGKGLGAAPLMPAAAATEVALAVREGIAVALEALSESPPRHSDALASLLLLPAACQHDKVVLRLKLLAFGALQFQVEYDATLAELRRSGA